MTSPTPSACWCCDGTGKDFNAIDCCWDTCLICAGRPVTKTEMVPSAERREEMFVQHEYLRDPSMPSDARKQEVGRLPGFGCAHNAHNFWILIAALDAQSAERARADNAEAAERIPDLALAIQGCEKHSSASDFETLGALIYRNRATILGALAANAEHERIMAECYQAVGMISESLGCQDDENYIRLLDMLAYGKTKDGKELLPFPVLPNNVARAEVENMREAAARRSEKMFDYTGCDNPSEEDEIACSTGKDIARHPRPPHRRNLPMTEKFKALRCWLFHASDWIGFPVHHRWDMKCTKCGREWTDYDHGHAP